MSQSSRTRFYDTKSESICPKLEAAMCNEVEFKEFRCNKSLSNRSSRERCLSTHSSWRKRRRKNFDEHSTISGRRTTKQTSGNWIPLENTIPISSFVGRI